MGKWTSGCGNPTAGVAAVVLVVSPSALVCSKKWLNFKSQGISSQAGIDQLDHPALAWPAKFQRKPQAQRIINTALEKIWGSDGSAFFRTKRCPLTIKSNGSSAAKLNSVIRQGWLFWPMVRNLRDTPRLTFLFLDRFQFNFFPLKARTKRVTWQNIHPCIIISRQSQDIDFYGFKTHANMQPLITWQHSISPMISWQCNA